MRIGFSGNKTMNGFIMRGMHSFTPFSRNNKVVFLFMERSNPTLMGINTVVLYVVLVALALLLFFFYFRNWMRLRKIAMGGEAGGFGEMPRAVKQESLKVLNKKYPGIAAMFQWVDVQLMQRQRADVLTIRLQQEWCCEDQKGTAEVPCAFRPKALSFQAEGEDVPADALSAALSETLSYEDFGFSPHEFLSEDEVKLLGWGLMERSRTLVPFRRYRMEVKRTTRTFHVENGVPVNWKSETVTMEEYTLTIH